MICPLMSKPAYSEHEDEGFIDKYSELYVVECRKEECALWIVTSTNKSGSTGHCGLISIRRIR